MKVIGLTGGIGSGKSTVSRFLTEMGAVIIDADKVGHELLSPNTDAGREVIAAFGKQVISPAGEIDRQKLGKMVFGNAGLLAQLNQIMHPRMYEIVRAQLEKYRQQGAKVVVIDAPLLLETNWASLADEVWVTIVSQSIVVQRLKDRMGLSEEESLARLRSQMSNEERIKHADKIIDTDCSLDELKVRVEEMWHKAAFDTQL